MTPGLQGPWTTSSSLLCFSCLSSCPAGPCASAPPSPPSSSEQVRLAGLVLTTAGHSVQCSSWCKGKKPHCEQPIYTSFSHTSSFFLGACSEAGQTWCLIRAKLFPISPTATGEGKAVDFHLGDLTNCTDEFSSLCSPLRSQGHKATHPIFS